MADVLGKFMGPNALHSDTVKTVIKPADVQKSVNYSQLPLTGDQVKAQINYQVKVNDLGVTVPVTPLARSRELYSDIINTARDFTEVAARSVVNLAARQLDPVTVAENVGLLSRKENLFKPPPSVSLNSLITSNVPSAVESTALDVIPAALDKRTMNLPYSMELRQSSLQTIGLAQDSRAARIKSLNSGVPAMRRFEDPLMSEHEQPRNYHVNQQGTQTDLDGFFRAKANVPESLPSDDAVYMPLVFTDLRKIGPQEFRAVYFKPYISSLTQDFAPDWNQQNYFGRVDPAANYQSTGRTLSISFKVVAESPEELIVNYRKMIWLESMNYPQYDSKAHYKAGPVIKLRVGDIFNAMGRDGIRGLPGFISSLSLDYSNSTWELINNHRVPREIDVTLSFQVLHEYPIGLVSMDSSDTYAESFGGIFFNDKGKWDSVSINGFHHAFGNNDWVNSDTTGNKG